MRKPIIYTGGCLAGKSRSNGNHHLKHGQSGMTLLEVIVAIFVLAIGVLGLLATQVKSVSSVREAEGQTIVAQAVQNLIEGMLINPTLVSTNGWARKSYDTYLVGQANAANCNAQFNNNMDKAALAAAQLCQFRNDLSIALSEVNVQYTVCRDASDAAPTVANNQVNFNCSGGGDNYVVKVVWQMDSEENIANSPLNMNGSQVVYSYQARVTQ